MDPASNTVRKESRLNKIVLLRFEPAALNETTKERATDGVVAYSAICPHGEMLVQKLLPRNGPSGWYSQACMSRADQSLTRHKPNIWSSASEIGTGVPSSFPFPTKKPNSIS